MITLVRIKGRTMKKFISSILVLCLIVVGFTFAGCGNSNNEIVLTGGPAYEDEISGNGGYVVSKGDYVYFTDAYFKVSSASADTKSSLISGDVSETGIYRAKMTTKKIAEVETPVLSDVKLMVKKSVGTENCGLYIFKDKLYFATPTTDSDKSGVRYDLLTFYSCNLDGSNVNKLYQTEKFSGGKYSMTMIDKTVYLMIYTGSEIITVSENGTAKTIAKDVTKAIFPTRTNIVNNEENPTPINCYIYFTKTKDKVNGLDNGNTLYKAEIKSGYVVTVYEKDKISINLLSLEGNRLFYSRTELIGASSISAIYSNSIENTFETGEIKHLSESSLSIVPLGIKEGKNLGFAYLNGAKKIIIKNLEGTDGESLESGVTSIITARNGYIYYVKENENNKNNYIYRRSLTDTTEQEVKLSGALKIKTDFFDIDEDFFYFFAEDTTKSTKTSLYRVELKSSSKTPEKMA